jgi:putative DNA methylase
MNIESCSIISPKKLIEVALPLDAINAAAAREKSIRHGHPSTLHLWWARRPLAAARAVIFSQLVYDPEDLWRCQNPGKEPNQQVKGHWTKARARLFGIIEELVLWENTTNEVVLEKAREEIRKAWRETCELNKHHPQAKELFNPDKMPGLHDPFAGGGAIPLEAQRLGLDAYASDLNPVAVLINKAMIEIPSAFIGRSPVNPIWQQKSQEEKILTQWLGTAGLADDVRFYGQWIRDEAFKRIGHLYPQVDINAEMVADRPDLEPYQRKKLTVIAWLWARTVKSPNPAFAHVEVPLVSTFVLSTKKGNEAYIEPITNGDLLQFKVRTGRPEKGMASGTTAGKRAAFRCIFSDAPIDYPYIRSEGKAGRIGERLLAVVAMGKGGRVFLSPGDFPSVSATSSSSTNIFPKIVPGMSERVVEYGFETYRDLFNPRQLNAMEVFAELVHEARARIRLDCLNALNGNERGSSKEIDAATYANAVSTYLALNVSKCADYWSSICTWRSDPKNLGIGHVFARQGIQMTWDYAEANPFSKSSGSWLVSLDWIARVLEEWAHNKAGVVVQSDARSAEAETLRFTSTDPPYYDNIGYADLSDFFYVWLRQCLREYWPTIFSTITVPKKDELVATPSRHGGKTSAEAYFLNGMREAIASLARRNHPAAPITIYYAFKQSETKSSKDTSSTGWATFLDAMLQCELTLTGTWPLRTEMGNRTVGRGKNALASSIVLVCRKRHSNAKVVSRRDFIRELNSTLPIALDAMTRESEGLHSPVAPVDLSQAIIGPGMAVFSKYAAVLEADGTPMTVRTALQLINRFLAEDDFDADTQLCLHWFEQYGWETGKFGEADTLARAKGTSVDGVKQAGVLHAAGGNVRLLKWAEYPSDWDPQADERLPIWEVLHQLIRVFNTDGETGAAAVFAAVQSKAEAARQLAYRLYTLCERKNWAEDARAYNEVVTSWSGIESAAAKEPTAIQPMLFDN